MTHKDINFATFTVYVITVRELLQAGFIHINEFYGSIRELKKEKFFTTSFAGATQMRITCNEDHYDEIMTIKNRVTQEIEDRRKLN